MAQARGKFPGAQTKVFLDKGKLDSWLSSDASDAR